MSHLPPLLLAVIGFILLLGPLVLVHELGHYLVGRWCGVRAEAFSIGFGKELAGWTDRRGTRWKLCALPLGGYVQFAGDMGPSSRPDDAGFAGASAAERAGMFQAHPLWQRALIVAAGPLTNILVALVIFTSFNLAFGTMVTPPVVGQLVPHSPAEAAGLLKGDRIVMVDGDAIDDFEQLRQQVLLWPGRTLDLTIRRDGREQPVSLTIATKVVHDRLGNTEKIGLIGVVASKSEIVRVGPLKAVALAGGQTVGIVRTLAIGIGQIFTGTRSVTELGGPIKQARFSGEVLQLGWLPFVDFVAAISINLAFINLLPIPTLDGGHLAFYAAEAVRRRPVDARGAEWAYRTGLAFVLALMLFVTINDLASLLPSRG